MLKSPIFASNNAQEVLIVHRKGAASSIFVPTEKCLDAHRENKKTQVVFLAFFLAFPFSKTYYHTNAMFEAWDTSHLKKEKSKQFTGKWLAFVSGLKCLYTVMHSAEPDLVIANCLHNLTWDFHIRQKSSCCNGGKAKQVSKQGC